MVEIGRDDSDCEGDAAAAYESAQKKVRVTAVEAEGDTNEVVLNFDFTSDVFRECCGVTAALLLILHSYLEVSKCTSKKFYKQLDCIFIYHYYT